MSGRGLLIDERQPRSLRTIVGRLLSHGERADFAVSRIRLAAVDLQPSELEHVKHMRVLVGRLDAESIIEDRSGQAPSAANSRGLLQFVRSGRVELRAAAGASWMPDFSVIRGIDRRRLSARGLDGEGVRDANDSICIVGAHFFARPFPVTGPAFTSLLTDPISVALALGRFESLWENAYDVLPVVTTMLAP